MPRRQTRFYPGGFYHLYNRGNNRQPIFEERENYLFLLERVRKYLLPVMDLVAYCLMPTHYHLLVRVKETSEVSETSEVLEVSRAMMRLSVSYTKAMNRRYARTGSLFQGSFWARCVKDDDHLVQVSCYLHLNPVLAGHVDQPEAWEFSSYREYIGARRGTLPTCGPVLSLFSSPQAYKDFVESCAAAQKGIALGFTH